MVDQKKLTVEQAERLLPDTPVIHTFRENGGYLLGADWTREQILERFRTHGVELSGENAMKIQHGLASEDVQGWLYIQMRTTPPEEKK